MTLKSDFNNAHVSDVVAFCMMTVAGQTFRCDFDANKRRRDVLLFGLKCLMRQILVPALDKYMVDVYPTIRDTSRPPMVLRFRRHGVQHRVCPLDADSAWAILDKSHNTHLKNVKVIIEAKSDEIEYEGVSPSNGTQWIKSETFMYYDKQLPIFKGLKQICTVADPSSHCGQESMVGLVYNWQLDQAAVGPVKIIPPATSINPEEMPIAPNVVMSLTEGSAERKKAYHQLQAVYALQGGITGNQLTDCWAPGVAIL